MPVPETRPPSHGSVRRAEPCAVPVNAGRTFHHVAGKCSSAALEVRGPDAGPRMLRRAYKVRALDRRGGTVGRHNRREEMVVETLLMTAPEGPPRRHSRQAYSSIAAIAAVAAASSAAASSADTADDGS